MDGLESKSEVARLMRQIELEYEAAQQQEQKLKGVLSRVKERGL